MLTFGEICARTVTNLQIPSGSTYATRIVPRFVQDAYKEIFNSELWDECVADDFQHTITANSQTFILDKQYGAILRAYRQDTGDPVKLVDRSSFADRAYNEGTVWTKEMLLDSITALSPSPVKTQPTTAQQVHVVSTSTDTVKVFIRGLDANGERISEVITLAGATPVISVNTYSAIEAWSKTARPTLGTITLTDSIGNTLATLGAWETTAAYPRYQIDGENPEDIPLTLTCKKAFVPFENDFDYPFTELDSPLIHKATAIGWREHRKLEMAATEEALFEKAMNVLRGRELNEDEVRLFVPAMRG